MSLYTVEASMRSFSDEDSLWNETKLSYGGVIYNELQYLAFEHAMFDYWRKKMYWL